MKLKKLWILISFLLSLKVVLGAEGPFSFFIGSDGLVSAIMNSIGFIITTMMEWEYTPAIAVFFMIFGAVWYLSRKFFFKDDKFKNAAILFSLALAAISLYGPFGMVGYVASLSTTSISLIFLFIFLLTVYIIATEMFGKAGESTGKMYEGFEKGSKGVGKYRKASQDVWKGDVDIGMERERMREDKRRQGAQTGEERGRDIAQRNARSGLRDSANKVRTIIVNLYDKLNRRQTNQGGPTYPPMNSDQETQREYRSLIASLQNFSNFLMDYDPTEINNLNEQIRNLAEFAGITPNDQDELNTNNTNIINSLNTINSNVFGLVQNIQP